MNRLFLMTHNLKGGGCERVISILANRLTRRGMEVTILTEHRPDCFYALDPGVRVVALSDEPRMAARAVPRVYRRLRALVLREKPDLVLAMPEKVNVWTVLYLIGTGVPVVVSERNDPARHPPSKVKRILRRFVYPFAAGFIFQTREQAAYFSPAIQKRGIVLDNPLDVSALPAPYAGEREKTVVSAGRLEEQKHFSALIWAFGIFYKTHPDWRLIIYGEGAEREALETLVASVDLKNAVSLPGQTKELDQKIRAAGMFVLPSDYEGLPNALIEAMTLGLPSISTDCPAGGPKSLISDGENGLLVPAADRLAMANAMARLADEPDLAARLSKNALNLRDRLDAETVVDKWSDYLESIAEKQHR